MSAIGNLRLSQVSLGVWKAHPAGVFRQLRLPCRFGNLSPRFDRKTLRGWAKAVLTSAASRFLWPACMVGVGHLALSPQFEVAARFSPGSRSLFCGTRTCN